MNPTKERDLADWINAEGLRGADELQLLAGFCERLVEAGIPLLRANINRRTLHPLVFGTDFEWWRDEGARQDDLYRTGARLSEEELRRFPFYYMHAEGLSRLRRRLDEPVAEFPLLEGLRQRGGTEYVAFGTSFGDAETPGPFRGFSSSWATDASGGFGDTAISAIERSLKPLALAIKASSTYRAAVSVLETYLGKDAGQRVLDGEIARGSAQTIRAVLWYADLQGFTAIADSTPRDQLITMLNDYFGCMVDAVHEQGGEVLKFMGDGLLAIFRLEGESDVCGVALSAAETAFARVTELNGQREKGGLPVTRFCLGLHLGDVLYGNIGGQDRLDFTVVGPAVNEVSRIEDMCRALDRDLIISSAFVEAAGACSSRIVSLGRYGLRGVRQPQELFTLAPPDAMPC
ncbi:MAG: adenylate/guanylate cyclase domain-containing protein [Alphaproteobacteria bacterium]